MMPKLSLHYLVAGEKGRKSRFHDESGRLMPMNGILYVPHALVSTVLRVGFGYRGQRPWLSYRAQRDIARIVRPDWKILEFGSGMSTAWLAQRCSTIYSIEHDPAWFGIVQAGLSRQQLTNTQCFLRVENYADLSTIPDRSIDFVLIDGIDRFTCACNVLSKVRPDGWVYLDNSDRQLSDYQQARQTLLDAANRLQGSVRYYIDFSPGSFVVSQGMLVQL